MDLDGFPLPPLRYVSGPDLPVWPPVDGEDTTSWWAHTNDGREVRIPHELIEELRAGNGGVVWRVDFGPDETTTHSRRELFQQEMDRVRTRLNDLASTHHPTAGVVR